MTAILDRTLAGPMAWVGETLLPNDGLVALRPETEAELAQAARLIEANPLPTEALSPDDFELPATRAQMAAVAATLEHGIGFAILDRLPVDRLSRSTATGLYWLLMSLIARPVAQTWKGEIVYDIVDDGEKTAPGNGVRSSKTNARQNFHTDNAFNLPPDYVSLLCLQTATAGGESGLVSLESVHNILRAEHRPALERLYQPFWMDRQREHAPGEAPVSRKPLFTLDDGTLGVAFSIRLVHQGYAVAGEEMDNLTRNAVETLTETVGRPGLGKSFDFAPGQIQVINNRRIGHRRGAYTDGSDPAERRHLVRLWMRRAGRPFYQG
jgi:alpha-ketoglutarate-dependent taurine dioxygenase